MIGEGCKRRVTFHGGPNDGLVKLVPLREYYEVMLPLPQRKVDDNTVDLVLRFRRGLYKLRTVGWVQGGELYHEYHYDFQEDKDGDSRD